eukprot:scaffold246314_cov56-Prasinocladus_malaysianus.AAC.1
MGDVADHWLSPGYAARSGSSAQRHWVALTSLITVLAWVFKSAQNVNKAALASRRGITGHVKG